MTSTKTPEEMAEEWAYNHEAKDWGTLVCPESGAVAAFLAGYQAAMQQLNSPEKPDSWISVKDRLPDVGDDVLVYGKILNDLPRIIGVRSFYPGDQDWKCTWESDIGYTLTQDDVSHWLDLNQLPEPPKEQP